MALHRHITVSELRFFFVLWYQHPCLRQFRFSSLFQMDAGHLKLRAALFFFRFNTTTINWLCSLDSIGSENGLCNSYNSHCGGPQIFPMFQERARGEEMTCREHWGITPWRGQDPLVGLRFSPYFTTYTLIDGRLEDSDVQGLHLFYGNRV